MAYADAKVYQYDGKLPFVQMMLNMMTAMGILDRLPANGGYSSFGHSPFSNSPWSRLSHPYSRALALQGGQSSPYGESSWGDPSWGVLPIDSYSRNYYSNDNRSPYSSALSSNELDGWVNEPWDNSVWNEDAVAPAVSSRQQPTAAISPAVPIIQNFNYNVPAKATQQKTTQQQEAAPQQIQKQSPLAKLAAPSKPVRRQSNQSIAAQNNRQRKPSPLRKQFKQPPCVTEFCGLKKPSLNGLWVAQNGEMLGVKNHRYLWSDSSSRYLTGRLKVNNEYLLASVDGYKDKLMRFKYKLAGNHLLTMQPDGKTREFVRMSAGQYNSSMRRYP